MVAGLILPVAGLAIAGLGSLWALGQFDEAKQSAALSLPFGQYGIWVVLVGVLCAAAMLWVAVK